MALEELRDDHCVVQDRVGAQLVIALERYDETRQIVTGDRVDRATLAEELTEAVKHGFIFAMGVGLFQGINLLQVFRDGYMERCLLRGFSGRFEAWHTQIAPFQFMALATLRLERLSCCYAGAFAPPRPAHVPLNVVTAIGQSVPVVVAFGISRNGKHLPSPVRFDAFDDVD